MEERYYATGRRKTSVARVWLTQGTGQIKINNRQVDEYFGEAVREQALMPLTTLGVEGDFDIWCTVKGGGITGQSGALRHGLARALVVVYSSREAMKLGHMVPPVISVFLQSPAPLHFSIMP